MNTLKNNWLKKCQVGDTALFEVEDTPNSQTRFQRGTHVTASRRGVKVTCTNFHTISHDFREVIPTVRVIVTSVDEEMRNTNKDLED